MGSEYNPEIYKVKAILLEDNKTVVTGFLCEWENKYKNGDTVVCCSEYEQECDDLIPIYHKVNSATICPNTRILVGDKYLYEFDLVERKVYNGIGLYYVQWNPHQKKYMLYGSLNYSGNANVDGNIKILGNIILNDDDFDRMQKYSDDNDAAYTGPEPTVECRSTQYLNKFAKEFLPR